VGETTEATKVEESEQRERTGVVNPRAVRLIAFTVITLSIVACTVLSILAVWEFTHSDTVWRAFTTLVIVSFAAGLFVTVNEQLSL